MLKFYPWDQEEGGEREERRQGWGTGIRDGGRKGEDGKEGG